MAHTSSCSSTVLGLDISGDYEACPESKDTSHVGR